jgi:hypothetical protein
MKITKKFEITITVDTEKANTNSDKYGENYDWNAYPNWEINYAGEEENFIKSCIGEFRKNFKFTGLKCQIKELK